MADLGTLHAVRFWYMIATAYRKGPVGVSCVLLVLSGMGSVWGLPAGLEPGELSRDASEQVEIPQLPRKAYNMACATCHGVDGKGAPPEQRGFDLPMPDLTDCNFATRESNTDWQHVASRGGPARAFSGMMPAMGGAMTEEEIERTLKHIRTFCEDDAWPRGALNLPRPLYTTKAFPEDEIVLATNWDSTTDQESVTTEFIWEQRFGKRWQYEVILPYTWTETADGWADGIDDIGLGLKGALWHDLDAGYIVSPGIEVVLPTGDDEKGIGSGTTLIEPFISYGQILPAGFFTQAQFGGAIPLDGSEANEEIFGRLNVGHITYRHGYWRRWTPMLELLYTEELNDGASGEWDIAPQLQVTLSARQHLRLGIGGRIPLNRRDERDPQFTIYLLWDWFDGGLFQGW